MRPDDPDLRAVEEVAAHIFSGTRPLLVQRVEHGISTYVYRVRRGTDTFYLRVLPEDGASFAPEARVHALLRQRGVRVPDVVYVEHFDETLRRSVMVTTEIRGCHVGYLTAVEDVRRVLTEAGHNLAIINSVPVDGFGWVRRDRPDASNLEGELPTYRRFAVERLEEDLAVLRAHMLSGREAWTIRAIVREHDAWLDVEQGRLAHGDFDVTHIYQQHGRYTGIIDFGEIRGADRYYDLGHFAVHDGETLPFIALPYLMEGYREGVDLPPDADGRIALSGLLTALRALRRCIDKGRTGAYSDYLHGAMRRLIAALHA